jgi:putative hydrolase of the HAD superfamily
LKAVDTLRIKTVDAMVFEDSPNGVRAARAAGIFVVSVPNPLTAQLKTDGADLTLGSLEDMSLRELLVEVGKSLVLK